MSLERWQKRNLENLGSLAKVFESYPVDNRDLLQGLELRSNRVRTVL